MINNKTKSYEVYDKSFYEMYEKKIYKSKKFGKSDLSKKMNNITFQKLSLKM